MATDALFRVPDCLISQHGVALGPLGIAVYTCLAHHADRLSLQCSPSYGRIAKEIHVSTRTVKKVVKKLEESGLVAVKRFGDGTRSNLYTLLWGELRAPACAVQVNQFHQLPEVVVNQVHAGVRELKARRDRNGNQSHKRHEAAAQVILESQQSLF
jgi:DNA-binding transcriptional regulator LsrR (DeoR family)